MARAFVFFGVKGPFIYAAFIGGYVANLRQIGCKRSFLITLHQATIDWSRCSMINEINLKEDSNCSWQRQ